MQKINSSKIIFKIAAIVDSNRFLKCARQRLSAFEWKGFQNQTLRRLFNKLTNIGNAILDEDKFLSVRLYVFTLLETE